MPSTAASDLVAAFRASRPAPAAGVDLFDAVYDRPVTRAGSGRAHKARGTYAPMTDERVAAFLAATEAR